MYITQRITKKWCHFAKLIISLNVLLLNVTRRWTFNAVPAPHLLSLFLTRQPYPPWKSQIAHSGIHPFGINFQIHFVSLTSLVSIHLLIHLSTHLSSSPPLVIHHFFTLSLQAQNLPFQQILPTLTLLFYPLDCLRDHGDGPDLPRSSVYF